VLSQVFKTPANEFEEALSAFLFLQMQLTFSRLTVVRKFFCVNQLPRSFFSSGGVIVSDEFEKLSGNDFVFDIEAIMLSSGSISTREG
jgi:hypothetical protein